MHLLAVLALAAHVAVAPPDSAELRGAELMHALRGGGYTILLRHARTDRSYQEAISTVPVERSAQRNLSEDGVRDAKLMGVVLRKFGIPIGEIVASPMFRTVETAEYAAGTPTSTSIALRTYPTTDETAAVVMAPAKPGTNRLLVTHHFVIEKYVPGIRPGDIGESEAAVVRPTGDGRLELVGRITLGDWERLAGVAPQPAAPHGATPHAAAPVPPEAASAAPVSQVPIPDTRAGRVATRYLVAFNSGDTARMRRFIETSLLPNPARPTDARLQTYVTMLGDFGQLLVTGVRASSPDEIALDIRTTRGDLVLTIKLSAEMPGLATSIAIGTAHGGHP